MRRIILSTFSAFLFCGFLFSQVAPEATAKARAISTYGKLPLSFEKNQGQTDAAVKFLARGQGYTLYLTAGEAVLATKAHDVMRMKLLGADAAAGATGLEEMAGKSNYFIGNDPTKWRTNVPTFAKVKFSHVYSGIDLVYYGNQRQLEYDFVVAPGADPKRIQFEFEGAKLRRDGHGDLVLKTSQGELQWHKPAAYQEKDGNRQEIAARYVIKDKNRVGFEIAAYDHTKPLFIDPLVYSTYLGGSGSQLGYGIALDNSGSAYVVGWTSSIDFPTANPAQAAPGGGSYDAFVTKFTPAGSALEYSTYLGGSGSDIGRAIAVDGAGAAYVTGYTLSPNFPAVNAYQPTFGGGTNSGDAFVTKIDPSGSALLYSTYLGGSGDDQGNAIAVDGAGSAYVTGIASSAFPTQSSLYQCPNAFVTKFDPAGSTLAYSTCLGGKTNVTQGHAIALDKAGNVFVAGLTSATDFPLVNPFQATCNVCNLDKGFISKLNAAGTALVYSSYLGGSKSDEVEGIAVDSAGNAYLTGSTESTDFPTVNAIMPTAPNGFYMGFVSKVNSAGSALVYSTYLGGASGDIGHSIAVDSSGNAYIVGQTSSVNFPIVNPIKGKLKDQYDGFVSEINAAGSAFVYSTFLGGSQSDGAWSVAVDGSGNAYVTGYTGSSDFPTVNAFQPHFNGGPAFVSKISQPGPPAVSFSPVSLTFPNQVAQTTSTPKLVKVTNSGQGQTLTINNISAKPTGGPFVISSSTCGAILYYAQTCVVKLTFTPPGVGQFTGTLMVSDSAAGSPQSVALSGAGVLPATLTPGSATYAATTVGTASAPKTFSLTNNQTVTLNNIVIGFTGADPGDFSVSSTTCGSTLASKGKCTINVVFKPTATGTRTANLSVSDDASNSPQTSSLTGTGK